MEAGNNKKKEIIKKLFSGELTGEERQMLSQLKLVENEMKKQWEKTTEDKSNKQIKELIWGKIQRKCRVKQTAKVHKELWQLIAASVAILLTVGTIWLTLNTSKIEVEKHIKIVASENQIHILPDSSKVWMEPGSSIEYIKAFNEDRKIKLTSMAQP